MRFFAGYGNLARKGLNVAGNMGYDFAQGALEYVGAQTTLNFDCCGLSFEYNRFALGSVRTENQYRFNFSLAGVGTQETCAGGTPVLSTTSRPLL